MKKPQLTSDSLLPILQKTKIVIAMIIFLNPLVFGGEPISKNDITGLWISSTSGNNPEMIYINESKFSAVLENKLYEFPWFLNNDVIMMPNRRGEQGINFELIDNQLTLKWDNGERTVYYKSPSNNTLDEFLSSHEISIELPALNHFNVIENLNYYSNVTLAQNRNGETVYYLDGTTIKLSDLNHKLSEKIKTINTFERNKYGVLLQIDKNIPMSKIMELRNKIAWTTLNYGYAGYPKEGQLSEMNYHRSAILVKMPPPDKPEIDKSFFSNAGINVITINVNDFKTTQELSQDVIKEQLISSKYLVSIEYDKNTSFEDYINILGLLHGSIHSLRNDLSMELYNVPYESLGEELKSDIYRIYPIAINEKYLN